MSVPCMAVCFAQFLSTVIFDYIDVSQRSVATRLRCGRMFNDDFITNLLTSLKNFENRSASDEVMSKKYIDLFFTYGVVPLNR